MGSAVVVVDDDQTWSPVAWTLVHSPFVVSLAPLALDRRRVYRLLREYRISGPSASWTLTFTSSGDSQQALAGSTSRFQVAF